MSHLSALRRFGLLDAVPDPIHVTVLEPRCPRGRPGLEVHRVARFPPLVRLQDLTVVDLPFAVTSAWHLLDVADRRAPAISAVTRRWTTPDRLREAVRSQPRLSGRGEMLSLVDLLAAGCESELEIWGHLHVFDVPGLRHASRQKWLRVGPQHYRLDLAYEAERVAVELDGARWHSGREQRERDMRRDAALASIDWLTLRYSHDRLHADPDGCRRDTLNTLAARRR